MDGLYGYAMVLTRNATVAADLVQETYVRAMDPMGRLREDSNTKAWLYTILRNIRLNQVRQQRTRPRLLADENTADLVIETAKDPHALHVSKLGVEQVREAIMRLPLEFREIILLREYGELSYQEIATLLDCSPGTAMSRMATARSKLRTLLPTTGRSSPSQPVRDGYRY
jgi:RNA polymerase sigma-70 factor (ECF subfamily)